MKIQYFKTQADLRKWLKKNHDSVAELWIGFYKKNSGKTGVTPAEVLDEMLCFGWIDGIRKSVDEISYCNRFTPRRAKSVWSKINTEHVKRLIKAGLMMPAGLEAVAAAKKDGRWDKAYNSPKSMEVPADFLKDLNKNKKAKAFYKTLKKANLFSIAFRLHNAKKPETREKLKVKIIEMLENGVTPFASPSLRRK
ncbi:YdeI/OmpD-associated family protein [Bdellovibrio sp. HCB274]|uniref:YdeI/OmpD-associated family protein n=1 Tax=Bdellovibrio sp. HCB274 TaxID=3394361 RepID=UPI0039B4BE20